MAKKLPLKSLSELSPEQLEEQRQAELAGNGGLPPEEVDESASQIDQILHDNELDGGMVRLTRRGPTENQFSYLCKIKVGEFDVDFIKKVYGGGDYLGQTFRANGQMYKKIEFSIDPRFQGTLSDVNKGGNQRAGGNETDPVALMRVMHDMGKDDKGSSAVMQKMMESQAQSTRDMMLMMQQSSDNMMKMMLGLTTAMVSQSKPVSEGLSTKDLLVILPTLVPLFKGDAKPATSLLETIEALKGMRELVSTGAVAETPEVPKSFAEKLLEALPHVATTVTALRGGQPMPQPRPTGTATPKLPAASPAGKEPIAGAPPMVTANPSEGAPAVAEEDSKLQLLANLVRAARRGSDVDLYHDLVMSELADEDVPMFQQVLTSEGWFDTLFGNLPDKTQIRPWFEQLRTRLLETFAQELTASNGSAEPVQSASSSPNSTGVQSELDAGGAAKDS